ncbi:MAG: hypothetical protein VZR73_18395 [Acutalibacteraceae bacterium]|nr:hypothetical protein [Acutalibacteraceae bacterium]
MIKHKLLIAAVVFLFTARHDTSMKTYMDYRTITNRESVQYELQQDCYTDADGLRRYKEGDEYVVAVGSPIAEVGDYITVELDDGTELDCIVGDSKGDRWYHLCGKGHNIVEFIVDTESLDKEAKNAGDVSCIVGDGNVERIEKDGVDKC